MRSFVLHFMLLLVLCGCRTPPAAEPAARFNIDDFRNRMAQLKPGMPHDQVIETLGLQAERPDKDAGSLSEWTTEYNVSPEYTVRLSFVARAATDEAQAREFVLRDAQLQACTAAKPKQPSLAWQLAD